MNCETINHIYIYIYIYIQNPLEKQGIIDNSGFKIYYTPTLRDIDAGVLTIGTSINQMGQWIPPGLSYAHNAAFLPNECTTNNIIPDDGIKIFASGLHQHTIGTALNLRHIRNGIELKPIDINLNYDFNYQQAIIFDTPKIFLPNDQLILDCYTDSSQRKYTTIGGQSSSQEMCLAFLFYYPKIKITTSSVSKTYNSLSTWMKDAQNAGYLNGTSYDIDNIFNISIYKNINPDFSSLYFNSSINGALQFYNRLYSADYIQYNKHNVFCVSDSGGLINDNPYNIIRDETFQKYNFEYNQCVINNTINKDNIDINNIQCIQTGGTSSPTSIDNNTENPNQSSTIQSILLTLKWNFVVIMLFLSF